MNAREVKDALLRRHPALDGNGFVGAWTCLEEWMNIDLLAVSAWASVRPYPRYARVGYEVKVSRSDYRRELARPDKRSAAVRFCHEFFFAVPRGLLKPDEIAWTPPWGFDREREPLARPRCPGAYGYDCLDGRARRRGSYGRLGSFDHARYRDDLRIDGPCPTCRGVGWITDSPAVRADAPKLWVPDDVGLVLVEETGRTIVAKKAPRRASRDGAGAAALEYAIRSRDVSFSDSQFADLVRWVSVRPDPRHRRESEKSG